ncbi:polysaccharide pyruvyl transferase family protein [Candidatus Peregrinibacteria bacterium]|nr:polysaccharide pyruvyl transferase family protein [Candidatus Peregrinibacteria bacterium]
MKIAICGYYGVCNMGDEAILSGLTRVLNAAYPNSSMELLSAGKQFPFGVRSFVKALFRPGRFCFPYRTMKNCNLFVLGGGGLFTDEEGPFVSTFWILHGLMALFFKKDVVCLGISIGPMNKINDYLAKKLFSSAKLITVRDQRSVNILKKWGIESHLMADFATLIPFDGHKEKNGAPYIIMSVRPFVKNSESLYKIFARFCDMIIKEYGFDIRFIPFHTGASSDRGILNRIFTLIHARQHIKIDSYYYNIPELLQVICNSEAVIGMRLHAGILAGLTGTPFVPISYMSKVSDFWDEFSGIQAINLKNVTLEALESTFKAVIAKRDSVRQIRQKLLEKARNTEKDLLAALKNL